MFKKLLVSVVVMALTLVGLVAVATPARATGASDASLAELTIRGDDDPGSSTFQFKTVMRYFTPAQDFYDVYSV